MTTPSVMSVDSQPPCEHNSDFSSDIGRTSSESQQNIRPTSMVIVPSAQEHSKRNPTVPPTPSQAASRIEIIGCTCMAKYQTVYRGLCYCLAILHDIVYYGKVTSTLFLANEWRTLEQLYTQTTSASPSADRGPERGASWSPLQESFTPNPASAHPRPDLQR